MRSSSSTIATLNRYWFAPDPDKKPTSQIAGCYGITAWNTDDAKFILSETLDHASEGYVIDENVDISELDSKHVLPNIKDVTQRGIWYPML